MLENLSTLGEYSGLELSHMCIAQHFGWTWNLNIFPRVWKDTEIVSSWMALGPSGLEPVMLDGLDFLGWLLMMVASAFFHTEVIHISASECAYWLSHLSTLLPEFL